MQLKEIHVKNFKVLKDALIEFNGFDVLVGVNNSGKTALQQALLWSDHIIRRCVNVSGNKIKWGNSTEYRIDIIPNDLPSDLWTNRKLKNKQKWLPIEFILNYFDSHSNKLKINIFVNLYYGGFHYKVEVYVSSGFVVKEFEQFYKTPILYIPSATGIVSREEYHTSGTRHFYLTSGLGGQTIRSSLYDFSSDEQKEKWKVLEKYLKQYFKIDKIKMVFDFKNDPYVRALYAEPSNEFEFVSAGNGFLQFVSILSRIMIENPRLILLDEPDAHLNTLLIGGLIDSLKKWQETSDSQIVIATHSPDVINSCAGNEIHVFDKGVLLDVSENVIQEAYNILGISQENTVRIAEFGKVFLYEGYSDYQLLWKIAKIVHEDFESKMKGIFCLPISGKEGFHHYEAFFKSLSNKVGTKIKIFFLRDRDLMSEDIYQKKIDSYRQTVKESYILGQRMIENYLIIYSVLSRVLKDKYKIDYPEELHEKIISNFISENDLYWESNFENDYARDHDKPSGDPNVRTEAKKEYRAQMNGDRLKIIDGRSCISYLAQEIERIFKKNIHLKSDILSNLTKEEINPELAEIIESLAQFSESDT
jgi:predicted ATPase